MSHDPVTRRFIVVEGPIGVGKTSLARRLAISYGCDLILEDANANPFLPRFYENPAGAALQTQLYFLFQRAEQIATLKQADMFAPTRVADFLIEKDRLFASLTLDEHEFELYDQVAQSLRIDAPNPDLVIYLQAPVEVLQRRIGKRGIRFEQRMGSDYLMRLSEAYTRFFYDYSKAPLLIVNAAEVDLVNNDDDYAHLLQRIASVRNGRHYFNPLPAMI